MKYLLLGDDYKTLFIEDDKEYSSILYSKAKGEWLDGGMRLWDARVGFDPSEPEGSPYRYGNGSCMEDIVEISKEEAEVFIGKKICEAEIRKILKKVK